MAIRILRRLRDLLDVDTSTAVPGDALVLDVDGETWVPGAGGGGGTGVDDADYLVGTAHPDLTAEIVVGTSPGGELGGTWASPTVDTTHAGSSHASVQAAAEATAAGELATHAADTTGIHGIADTSALATSASVSSAISASEAGQVRDGDAAGGVLGGTYPNPSFAADMATQAELDAHVNDTSAAHAASAVSASSATLSGTGTDVQAVLEELDNLLDDHSARHENGGADEISIAGLDGTSVELAAHLADASDAHDASAISILDTANDFTATDVEGALAELQTDAESAATAILERLKIFSSEPADGTLATSEIVAWYDNSNTVPALHLKAKTADGTLASATIPLTPA